MVTWRYQQGCDWYFSVFQLSSETTSAVWQKSQSLRFGWWSVCFSSIRVVILNCIIFHLRPSSHCNALTVCQTYVFWMKCTLYISLMSLKCNLKFAACHMHCNATIIQFPSSASAVKLTLLINDSTSDCLIFQLYVLVPLLFKKSNQLEATAWVCFAAGNVMTMRLLVMG